MVIPSQIALRRGSLFGSFGWDPATLSFAASAANQCATRRESVCTSDSFSYPIGPFFPKGEGVEDERNKSRRNYQMMTIIFRPEMDCFGKTRPIAAGPAPIVSEWKLQSIAYEFIDEMKRLRNNRLINLYRVDGMQMSQTVFSRTHNEIVTTLSNLDEDGTNRLQIELAFRKV